MKKIALLCLASLCAGAIEAQSPAEASLTNVRRVTSENELKFENPQFSPDGQHIAFTRMGFDGLYVVGADGTGMRQISDAAGVGFRYQWGVDSKEILVRDTRYLNEKTQSMPRRVHALWSVNLEGVKTRLSEDSEDMQPAVWNYSPTGQKRVIAPGVQSTVNNPQSITDDAQSAMQRPQYTRSLVTDTQELYLVDADGGSRIIYHGCALAPALSPDGQRVAFVTERDEILIMRIDGTGREKVGKGFNPAWLGCDQLVYERTSDDGHEYTAGDLYLYTIPTAKEVRLTSTSDRIEMNPAVSPDGRRIAFTDYSDGQIYVGTLNF